MSEATHTPQRLGMTPGEIVCIGQGARSISPSWGATFVPDEQSESLGFLSVGALAGGSDRWDAVDTYCIARVGPNQITLSDTRDFATLGTFPTIPEAVKAMKAHAAAVRY